MVRIYKAHIEYVQDDLGASLYAVRSVDEFYRVDGEAARSIVDRSYLEFGEASEFRTIASREDLEIYIEFIAGQIRLTEIPERRVVIACSMGKDSAAGFVILYELWSRGVLKHRPIAAFTYMPVLEDIILRLSDKFLSKFGEFLHIIEVPKSTILEKLQTTGYPTLQEKWCRALKMGSIKKFMKQLGKENIVYAECERLFESVKRLRSLYGARAVFPKKIQPVIYLTESDVMTICKMYDVVHGMYEYGAPRTSCALCPYAPATNHILHMKICEKLGIDIEPLIKSMQKLVRYYTDLGFGDRVRTELDVIKYGLYSYRHTHDEVKTKMQFFDQLEQEASREHVEAYAERSRRYFLEYLEKVRYYPLWRMYRDRLEKAEKTIREIAKRIIKTMLQTCHT